MSADNPDVPRPSSMAAVLLGNLMRGLDGKVRLGFAKPRIPAVDALADRPFLRLDERAKWGWNPLQPSARDTSPACSTGRLA